MTCVFVSDKLLPDMKPITKRLRHLRLERGFTQRDLIEKVEMSKTRYWEIEKGYREPEPSEVRKLARALKCQPTDIVPSEAVEASQ